MTSLVWQERSPHRSAHKVAGSRGFKYPAKGPGYLPREMGNVRFFPAHPGHSCPRPPGLPRSSAFHLFTEPPGALLPHMATSIHHAPPPTLHVPHHTLPLGWLCASPLGRHNIPAGEARSEHSYINSHSTACGRKAYFQKGHISHILSGFHTFLSKCTIALCG